MNSVDVLIAGGGPAGLSAACAAADAGATVLLVEQNTEIGSPIRTTGGSFIPDLIAFGIPQELLHPIHRCRFVSPTKTAIFEFKNPILCVMDVHGVYQHLATEAIRTGAKIWLGTTAIEVINRDCRVSGARVRSIVHGEVDVTARIVIDATGYKSTLMKTAGLDPGFKRFGVGAEYDLFAPHCNQTEAVLIVGNQIAPSGYAWAFPWGGHRVRVGVGTIHPDSSNPPISYLEKLVANSHKFGIDLKEAQPVEYHSGLIPSDICERFVGDGIMAIGDAAGQASTLVGEGIRWAIRAGKMAGDIAAEALRSQNANGIFLKQFESQWLGRYGRNLRIANAINKKVAKWDDKKWDERTELLSLLTAEEYATALQINFSVGWALAVAWAHPKLLKEGLLHAIRKLGIKRVIEK
jgi:digeranylgeranylglycerophospholipid reductase